ncbi:hlyD family secretion protein [Vibrio sp. JCM 19236]|nr:hlyD family secretion protein [Vibrio sp. JCM 19236]
MKAQEASLKLTIERLTALIEEREPDYSEYEESYPAVVAEQRAQLAAAKKLYFQKRIVLEKESEQIAEQLKSINRELPAAARQLKASQNELAILEKGQKSGSISKIRVLEMRQTIASIEAEVEQDKGKKAVLINQAESTVLKIDQLLAEAKLEASKERSKAVDELSALRARLRSGQAKVSNTLVTSPVKGLIQSLPTTKKGGVIQPAGTIVEIVPVEVEHASKPNSHLET